jgi:hypothetical protein
MNKALLLASALIVSGITGSAMAGETASAGTSADPGIVARTESHYRIFKLQDRIENQRKRIDKGLTDNTLTADQAKAGRVVIDAVADALKAEAKAHGAKKIMSKEQYEAYNASLDSNSTTLSEERQFFYYYGPYSDWGADYNYFYDPYGKASAPTPSVSTMAMKNPRIFELKDRIKNQRARIDQGLNDASLTMGEAKASRDVLASLESRINTDYKSNGTKRMTRKQYDAYNADLDVNSTLLHEEKSYFYYYSPYYDRFSYWD